MSASLLDGACRVGLSSPGNLQDEGWLRRKP